MCCSTSIHIPEREVEIALKVIESSEFQGEVVLHRDWLGLFEKLQRIVVIVRQPQSRCEAKPRFAPIDVVSGQLQGATMSRHAFSNHSNVVQELAVKSRQRELIRSSLRQFTASFNQSEGALIVI